MRRGCGGQDDIEPLGLTGAGCAEDVENHIDNILAGYSGLTVVKALFLFVFEQLSIVSFCFRMQVVTSVLASLTCATMELEQQLPQF